MGITWSSIQIPEKPKKQYNKANWTRYVGMLHHTSEINIQNGDHPRKNKHAPKTIQTAIQEANQICIPVVTQKTLPHPSYT